MLGGHRPPRPRWDPVTRRGAPLARSVGPLVTSSAHPDRRTHLLSSPGHRRPTHRLPVRDSLRPRLRLAITTAGAERGNQLPSPRAATSRAPSHHPRTTAMDYGKRSLDPGDNAPQVVVTNESHLPSHRLPSIAAAHPPHDGPTATITPHDAHDYRRRRAG